MVLQETAPISYVPSSPEATIARLRRLLEVNLALTSVGDTGELLDLIARTATTVADCEAASILLLDERTGELRFEAATGEAGAMLVGTEVPLYESLSGVTFRENRIVHATDVTTDERHFGGADERTGFVTRAVLCVNPPRSRTGYWRAQSDAERARDFERRNRRRAAGSER